MSEQLALIIEQLDELSDNTFAVVFDKAYTYTYTKITSAKTLPGPQTVFICNI